MDAPANEMHAFEIAGIVLLVIALIVLAWGFTKRNATEMAVTNKRVLIKTGLGNRRTLDHDVVAGGEHRSGRDFLGADAGIWVGDGAWDGWDAGVVCDDFASAGISAERAGADRGARAGGRAGAAGAAVGAREMAVGFARRAGWSMAGWLSAGQWF